MDFKEKSLRKWAKACVDTFADNCCDDRLDQLEVKIGSLLNMAYERGRRDENEACAKVAETLFDQMDPEGWPAVRAAAAIRQRIPSASEKEKTHEP